MATCTIFEPPSSSIDLSFSNFTRSEDGGMMDNQFGIIWLE
jgi:hypothetical protein